MNIVFIDIDTLRCDRLGCYGYHKPTSPNIDALAAQSTQFTYCYAVGIPTTPAHTSIYTGLHPIHHGVVTHGGDFELAPKTPVFPELLQKAGYTTCAIDNLYDLKKWFARGYEFYINPSHKHPVRLMVTGEEQNKRAMQWLDHHKEEKFFLFIHYWDTHTPYFPPQRFRMFYEGNDPFDRNNQSLEPMKRQPFWRMWEETWFTKLGNPTDTEYLASLYDGEVSHVDECVGELLDHLEKLELAEQTMIILTGDHGESMTEHDIYFDHHGLYENTVRVPLLIRHPEAKCLCEEERRSNPIRPVTGLASHLDLMPTILDAAEAKPPPLMHGQSLLPQARGETPSIDRDFLVIEECTWQAKWAMRDHHYKLIHSLQPDRHDMPMTELYDLEQDPGEEHNLASQDTSRAQAMGQQLEAWIEEQLRLAGRDKDPLVEQGITLGKRWDTL